MVPLALILTFLIHLTLGYNDELFPLSDADSSYFHPDEYPDENDFKIHRRNNNNFLRFGRSGYDIENEDYDIFTRPTESDKHEKNDRRKNIFVRFGRSGYDIENEDYDDFARPTRSGKPEKNDYFIRFGRSKQDFLRFGRDQHRQVRDKSANYLRFGRSIPEAEEKKRSKRDAFSDFKRGGSNFMRFGRNSNFLRFGRNNEMATTADPRLQDAPLIQLLSELLENIKKEHNKNSRIV